MSLLTAEVPVCGEEESSSSDVSRAGNIINLALAEVAVMSGMKEDSPGTVFGVTVSDGFFFFFFKFREIY